MHLRVKLITDWNEIYELNYASDETTHIRDM